MLASLNAITCANMYGCVHVCVYVCVQVHVHVHVYIATGSWPSNTKGEEAYSALFNVTSFYPSL